MHSMTRTMNPRPASVGRRSRRHAGGFVMLEALIGGLIFAIGVLGVVSLQAAMARAQTGGKFRGDAVYLADEMAGLLWSDRTNLNSYNAAQCSAYPRCSDWAAKVGSELPGGTPTVVVAPATGIATVSISWTTRSGTQTYATQIAVTP